MFVKRTTPEDIDNIEFNEYVIHSRDMLKTALDYEYMYSFFNDNGVIELFAGFFEFYPHCWKCGIIASKHLNKYNLPFIRNWMLNECKKRGCIRLETEGINNPALARFHKFFGFVPEVVINNGGFIKWVLYLEEAAAVQRPHLSMM